MPLELHFYTHPYAPFRYHTSSYFFHSSPVLFSVETFLPFPTYLPCHAGLAHASAGSPHHSVLALANFTTWPLGNTLPTPSPFFIIFNLYTHAFATPYHLSFVTFPNCLPPYTTVTWWPDKHTLPSAHTAHLSVKDFLCYHSRLLHGGRHIWTFHLCLHLHLGQTPFWAPRPRQARGAISRTRHPSCPAYNSTSPPVSLFTPPLLPRACPPPALHACSSPAPRLALPKTRVGGLPGVCATRTQRSSNIWRHRRHHHRCAACRHHAPAH